MKATSKTLLALFVAVSINSALLTLPVLAQATSGIDAARGSGVPTNLSDGDGSIIKTVINFMLYGIGILSVIMLIIGGFRYVISGGQKDSVTAAKNTILYAIIGLLIAIFAYAIVRFVVNVVIGGAGETDV
ncbi:hypothetical protein CR969_03195 [Candidatus Saccharibacteria bacterium]|nr:MAG: hypothetical protein CR969_03195 [Candidatus Saccharibacteria bacterium]